MNINETDKLLLMELINDGKLVSDNVPKQLYEMKKKKVDAVHKYDITEPKTEKARWQTYLPSDTGTRGKKVSATTEERLYQKLYDYYFVNNRSKVTLETLYPEWLNKRNEMNLSDRTIHRDTNRWDKYYKEHPIIKRPVAKIKPEHLEKFFHQCIKDFNLTKKELDSMKFIMKELIGMALKKEIISKNPFDLAEIKTYGCKQPTKKNDRSRVYLPSEKEKMFMALNMDLLEHPDVTDAYAVFLLFKLGPRIGEVAALKGQDIDFKNKEIHIQRMESKEEDENGKLVPVIVEYTKTESSNRFLDLDDYTIDLLTTVMAINKDLGYDDDDFIFVDANGRTKIREIDTRIRKCCKSAGIEVKSAHDIRRTVASELHANNVPIELIRDLMGHEEISTTYGYIYDNNEKSERKRIIHDALSSMNELKETQRGTGY